MMMGTPRSEQGQMVECSYGWHDGDYYRRCYDRSVRSESWARAADEDEVAALAASCYDAGGADYPPAITQWVSCAAPEAELGKPRKSA